MLRCGLMFVAIALTGASVAGQDSDPTRSAACRDALDALQAAEAASAPPASAKARLQPLRQRAAKECLGGTRAGPPPSQRGARAPISVAPVTIVSPAVPRALPPLPEVTPPRPIGPPTVVLRCDSTQCWASDGSVLQRAGTVLIGPRGACRAQGNELVCP
jgi:hypothetical protein